MQKLKVLIAEDQEDMLRALVRRLSRNFEIIAAVQDGKYLVEGAISLKPDVIVSDVSMPLTTGPQALKELTRRGCRIPFVFITAETELISPGPWSVVDKVDIFVELESAIKSAALGKVYLSSRARLLKGM
jgi:CheY-like chemotaxis protein